MRASRVQPGKSHLADGYGVEVIRNRFGPRLEFVC